MAAPFNILVAYADGSNETFHKTVEVWKANQKQINVELNTAKTIRSVEINGGVFMDADEANNKWTAK